jgi:hypothetical protein
MVFVWVVCGAERRVYGAASSMEGCGGLMEKARAERTCLDLDHVGSGQLGDDLACFWRKT